MENIKSPGFFLYLSYFYSYYLPIILYVLWTPLCLYDLGKKDESDNKASIFWTLLIIVIPWLGSLLYMISGKSKIPLYHRYLLILPGLILILLFGIYSTISST